VPKRGDLRHPDRRGEQPTDVARYNARERARLKIIRRLGLDVGYDGPLSARGLPTALGDFILDQWRRDDSVSSTEKVDRLIEALRLAPSVALRNLEDYLVALEVEWGGLTHVERKSLYFQSLGFEIKEIARLEGVGENAVKERLRRARRKLGAMSTTQAVAIAIRKGWLWH